MKKRSASCREHTTEHSTGVREKLMKPRLNGVRLARSASSSPSFSSLMAGISQYRRRSSGWTKKGYKSTGICIRARPES